MRKLILLILIVIGLSSCEEGKPQHISVKESKESFDIEFLFEVDSIKVYRFNDDGHAVYFSNSQGRFDNEYTTGSGKHRRYHDQTTLSN